MNYPFRIISTPIRVSHFDATFKKVRRIRYSFPNPQRYSITFLSLLYVSHAIIINENTVKRDEKYNSIFVNVVANEF